MIDKRVKIIKDTVSHRLPIGSIVKIKSFADKIIKGKKCYNVLDFCCYVSEADVEILKNQDDIIEKSTERIYPISAKTSDDWFDSVIPENKIKKGDIVYAKNVTALTPNGTQLKANNGNFIIYEEKNNRYWLRRKDDINEYFCKISDVRKI